MLGNFSMASTSGHRMSRAMSASVLPQCSGFQSNLVLMQAQPHRLVRPGPLHMRPASQGPQRRLMARNRSAPLLDQAVEVTVSQNNPQDPQDPDPAAPAVPLQQRRRVAPLSSAVSGTSDFRVVGSAYAGTAQPPVDAPNDVVMPTQTPVKCAEVGLLGCRSRVFSLAGASVVLQKWWRNHLRVQKTLFEDLVVELMELRREAALEIQRAWRASIRKRKRLAPR
eukprot:TRINITY_DN45281_c0_g1_i1.p1 TRINITY_DN45281_c0_g1~~TRINITY_DN45281_c0_g1_i1.p1  ORF type:complete len:224 (-),score=18.60 TRINITY_DN45281_c0_g1_i1:87-758(-)